MQAVASRIVCQLSPDKVWRISITPYKAKRSLEQNDRWQALTREIARETGDDHESVKRDLKLKFGFYEEIERDGQKYLVLKSTTKADVGEMSELMEQAEAFAARELGVMLG